MSNLPIVISILVGILTYVVGVLMIPRKITADGTSFTRRQLKAWKIMI